MNPSNNIKSDAEFQKRQVDPLIWLTDNGSLKPEATLALRSLCAETSDCLGKMVDPVSLLHSSKIDPELIGGISAKTFERSTKAAYESGYNLIWLQPLFFGPSAALTEYLPERVRILKQKRPELRVKIASSLIPNIADSTPRWLLEILADHANALRVKYPKIKKWLLVDHGSPRREVAEVRDRVALDFGNHWLASHPDDDVKPASMERREGEEYAFCDPLLENAAEYYGWDSGEIGVLMLFFLPGRHAGPCGDVADIIKSVEASNPDIKMFMSPLFAEHPRLAQVLAEKIDRELSAHNFD